MRLNTLSATKLTVNLGRLMNFSDSSFPYLNDGNHHSHINSVASGNRWGNLHERQCLFLNKHSSYNYHC